MDIEVRSAIFKDLDDVVRLENKIWPEGTRASREKFESRLKFFPDGFFVAYKDERMIGVSTSEIINYDFKNHPISWEEITDNGFIRNTHDKNGNALYVVSLGAISRSGGGGALIEKQKKLVIKLGLDCLILGARISGYDKYCVENGEIGVKKYLNKTNEDGQVFDDEIRFYTRNGLEIVKIVKNYMEDDLESRNFGAVMIWKK